MPGSVHMLEASPGEGVEVIWLAWGEGAQVSSEVVLHTCAAMAPLFHTKVH